MALDSFSGLSEDDTLRPSLPIARRSEAKLARPGMTGGVASMAGEADAALKVRRAPTTKAGELEHIELEVKDEAPLPQKGGTLAANDTLNSVVNGPVNGAVNCAVNGTVNGTVEDVPSLLPISVKTRSLFRAAAAAAMRQLSEMGPSLSEMGPALSEAPWSSVALLYQQHEDVAVNSPAEAGANSPLRVHDNNTVEAAGVAGASSWRMNAPEAKAEGASASRSCVPACPSEAEGNAVSERSKAAATSGSNKVDFSGLSQVMRSSSSEVMNSGLSGLVKAACCALCGGDGDADGPCGRLLPVGLGTHVHVNCAMWSSEVVEKETGTRHPPWPKA